MKPMHKWYLADAGDAGLQESVEKKAGFAAVEEKKRVQMPKMDPSATRTRAISSNFDRSERRSPKDI
jgi:hypothetical protein